MLALLIATELPAAPPETTAAWSPNDISVSQSVPGQCGKCQQPLQIAQNGDARITVDRRDGSTHATGTVLLIGGRWMITQGFAASPGKEVELLDLAVLNSQLVVVLLTAALPEGPPASGPPQHVRFAEKTNPIRTRAALPRSTSRPGPHGTVIVPAGAPPAYQLSFTLRPGVTHGGLCGNAGNAKSPLDVPDSMKLAGWKIRRLPQSLQQSLGPAGPGSRLPATPKAATVGGCASSSGQ
jgi:hypothetical protein